MNSAVVRNAVGVLEKLLSQAKSAERQIGAEVFKYSLQEGGYENADAALEYFLNGLHDRLLVVLEAAELPGVRASLIEAWKGLASEKEGLRYVECDPEFEICSSPALTLLDHIIDGMRIAISGEISSEGAWTLSRLEAMLRDTPGLVHRRGQSPSDEFELQKIMHDYLGACFPDFQPNPPIGGTLKTFKPDCGIRSVGAAIEFKIVRTKEEMAIAFSGVAEDTAGYKGSKDWTRFYAVIYQAEPFMLESHLRSDLRRIGAATWTPIVVNGPSKKKARKDTAERRSPTRKKAIMRKRLA